MGRNKGSEEQRDLSREQLRMDQQWRADQRRERQEMRSTLMPEIMGIPTEYAPEEKQSIMQSALDATGGVYDVARARASRHRGRTRQTAGYSEAVGELTRQEAGQKAGSRRSIESQFADEKWRRTLARLDALASLYGIDTRLLASTAGLSSRSLYGHAQGISRGSIWGDVISGAAQVGAVGLGGIQNAQTSG